MRVRALLGMAWVVASAPLARAEAPPPPTPPVPSLDRASVPARGRQTATLVVPAFGRYAIRVESKQGTTLQLVDRMAGPGEVAGRLGEVDGRLDLLLDRGEYQLVTTGHRRASGEAKLDVRPFAERHAPKAPLLVELKPVDEELGDFEQASWWLDLPQPRTVWLEAAGRSLADLRLWRDGTWLVAAEPAREVVQPAVGKPLLVCRLAVALEPGLYLLTAYGGAPRPWAVDDGGQPFHLRFGIPSLGEAGRQRMTVSAFGRDLFLVPGRTSFFRLELPEARPATLEVGTDPTKPFASGQRSASIAKTSRPPVAEMLFPGESESDRVVTVSGEADQPYVLQHFELRDTYAFGGSGDYWVSTVHAGAAVDSIDATGILVRSRRYGETRVVDVAAEQTIPLDARSGWARRANLLDTATLFVNVRATGTYEVTVDDIAAEVRVEPFMLSRPTGYQAPPWQASPSRWDLDVGYYVVSLQPKQKGIARIAMRPRGLVDRALEAVGLGKEQPLLPPRPSVRFAPLSLDGDRDYTLFLGRQPEVHAGTVVRRLPLDLSDPVPVAQTPGDSVSLRFRSDERGTLCAEAEDGQRLEMSLDGGAWDKQPSVAPGSHEMAARLPGKETLVYSVRLEPERLARATPLPALPDARLASLPRFEVLTAEAAQLFNLPAGGSRTFLVRADRPGLYRVQSTGLLASSGTLRSRTVTSLARAEQNGVGRNFSLGQYLREGDYQVTARVAGRSAGHLGLELVTTRVAGGGDLRNRVPARVTLPAGEAVAYRFTITRPGRFRVRSLGLERAFRCRIEDERGWPLVTPGGAADLTLDFEPGRYRYIVLPETTPARVVTLIEPVAAPVSRRGHGPHRLRLAQRVEHVWLEPEAGERVPDRWELDLPAPAKLRIELTGGMEGRLLPRDAAGAMPIDVPVGQGFEGLVVAGSYRLEVVSARPNNRATYQLAVSPEPLVTGLDRGVNVPAEVEVSIGATGLYELATFGASDVRGRLLDGSGRLVAQSDDRPDDWNVQIGETLTPGVYRLRLEPVGQSAAFTTVSLRRREENEEGPLSAPAEADLSPGVAAHLYPLVVPAGAELVAAVARSGESVGLALETREGEGWRRVAAGTGREARAESAIASGREYRLRVWSLDRRDSPVHLTVLAPAAPRTAEAQARAGLRPGADTAGSRVVATAVAVERPGSFRVEGDGVRWCAAPLVGCVEAHTGIVSTAGPLLWALGPPGMTPKAARLAISGSEAVSIALPRAGGATVDLAAGSGLVLVHAVSQGGQPGLAVGRPAALGRSSRLAVGTRAAIAVSIEDGPLAALAWNATPGPTEITADLEAVRFPRPAAEDAASHMDETLDAGAARLLKLPRGFKRVRLALSAAVVAALSLDSQVTSVHWAETGSVTETVETDADRLTLFPPREGSGRYALEVFPLEAAARTEPLTPGASFETRPSWSSTLRLAVTAAKEPSRVHVRGASGEALLVSTDGEVRRGSDLDVPTAGGTLLLPHVSGLVVAMREPPAVVVAGAERPVTVKAPASVVLRGPAQTLRAESDTPALLHVRAPGPALTSVRRGDEPAEIELHPEGVRLDAYLPGGPAEVTIRAIAGATLHGAAEVTTTPVVPIGEGLGPEVLLGPGQSRLFSFTVAHAGAVGLGVRADADRVEMALLSSAGQPLGRGSMQMPSLEPGAYLLALSAPADAAPVRARPAVVGLVPPETGPPEDVVRQYVEASGEEEAGLSFTARHVGPAPEAETGAVEGEAGEEASPDEPTEEESEPPTPEPPDASSTEGGLS